MKIPKNTLNFKTPVEIKDLKDNWVIYVAKTRKIT